MMNKIMKIINNILINYQSINKNKKKKIAKILIVMMKKKKKKKSNNMPLLKIIKSGFGKMKMIKILLLIYRK